MPKLSLAELQQLDRHLPVNCHTVSYGGSTEGIELSLIDPWGNPRPAIQTGGGFVARDSTSNPEQGPLGALYHPKDGTSASIYRANLHLVQPFNGDKPFHTLRRVDEELPSASIVLVKFGLPPGYELKSVKADNGREFNIRVWQGMRSTSEPIVGRNDEWLVELRDGDELTLFFPDGLVRQFVRTDGQLVEEKLTPADMLSARIADARLRLEQIDAADLEREEWQKATYVALAQMVDLLHLTWDGDRHHELVYDLFLELREEQLQTVHRKLLAVLHQANPILAQVVNSGGRVVSLSSAAPKEGPDPKRAEALRKKRERAAADRQRHWDTKGPGKGSSGGNQSGKKDRKVKRSRR